MGDAPPDRAAGSPLHIDEIRIGGGDPAACRRADVDTLTGEAVLRDDDGRVVAQIRRIGWSAGSGVTE